MIKKFTLTILFFLLMTSTLLSSSNVFISVKINNKIITNYDIEKEKIYLKILNPGLSKLSEKKITNIAKNSLINEVIKKDELQKFFPLNKKILYIDQVFIDLYKRLNLKSENEFINLLSIKETYSIKEIRNKLRIEILWNELIFKKYRDQVKIKEKILIEKINNEINKVSYEYLLSEIFFKKKKDESLNQQINKIKKSIKEVGFNNTANIFSISESANYGGKIGWVNENNLSKNISIELKKINIGESTKVIQIGNNFLILKINQKRSKKKSIDKNARLEEMKRFETNRQLSLFSNIYFNKVKINYSIDEK
jgi:peptidyl-prolyl cis-trans isomerase SurA